MNLLKRAGVDLSTPAPAEAVVAQLDKRVSQLERRNRARSSPYHQMSLNSLHPLVRDWFAARFGRRPSRRARVAAIRSGEHVLISAPTGSGKTLAAFLICLDDLVRRGLDGDLPETTQVLYVSPLKALSNDIHKNLDVPLSGIAALAAERGLLLPPIRTAVRTGDTPTSERQKMLKHPPHILVTTRSRCSSC
jgi:ATP-dependent Lhr-like helicase